MFADSSLNWLSLGWLIVTVAFIVLMIWKSLVAMREEDVVYLSEAEGSARKEQQDLVARVQRLTAWAKALGLASLALIVATGSLWFYRALNSL